MYVCCNLYLAAWWADLLTVSKTISSDLCGAEQIMYFSPLECQCFQFILFFCNKTSVAYESKGLGFVVLLLK